LICLLVASACSKSNATFNNLDLSSSDDLSMPNPDSGGGMDGGGTDGGGGDGGVITCVTDQLCFTGSDPSKRNVGSCRDGIRNCVNGILGPCSGEVLPANESCNGLDDDCDGTVDNGLGNITCGVGACARPLQGGAAIPACVNGAPNATACVPGTPTAEICGDGIDQNCDGVPDDGCSCVFVAPPCPVVSPPAGCYTAAADIGTCGSQSQPCATVKYAIEQRAGTNAGNTVCIASLANCAASAARTAFNYVESGITMKNGVSVLGGFDLAASPSPSPSARPRSPNACVTRVSVNSHNAVTFDNTITSATTLDGVEIVNTDTTDNITTGVAVLGSTGAIISNSYIYGGGGTAESHGVRVTTGARPLLVHNAIVGGTSPLAVGVSSNAAVPTIRNHCDVLNAGGRCSSYSCNPAAGPRIGLALIHGRGAGGTTRTNAYGVLLTDSPGALVESSAIHGSQCIGGLVTTGDVAGVRITGDASDTVLRGNFITALQAGANAVGVWADTCAGAGASLWLFNNEHISGNSPQLACLGDGVRAEGSCHPRIDGNVLIRGGEEGSNSPANGVYCKSGSQCTILRNGIEGSGSGFPPTAAGVRCDDSSCARIEGNRITGRAGIDTFGIVLGATGVLVTTNLIDAGCTNAGEGVGVESVNSFAQLQNNVIRGVVCTNTSTASSWALRDAPGAGTNEIDVNGNNLLGMGDPNGGACVSQAVAILNRGAGAARGLYRNNILHAGFCPTSYDVIEQAAPTVARVFNHNDLWHTGTATALYSSGSNGLLTTISGVNLLTDPTGNSNFEAEPSFTNPSPIAFPMPATPNYHLQAASMCINKGVAVSGGPTTDYDNPGNLAWQSAGSPKTRTNTPDVGADEAQ
jgi:hypothetical protein